jgi:hypothetical protein
MFYMFLDLLMIIFCIVSIIINFINKKWYNVSFIIIILIHSCYHFSNHFVKRFIKKNR